MARETATILLAEDNDAHAELIATCLDRHPIAKRLYRVADGRAALDFLFRQGDFSDAIEDPHPDLILLDLRLPKVNGLQVLKEITAAEDLRHIPLVVLSTSGAAPDVTAAYEAHANRVLVKPVELGALSNMLNVLID